MTKIILLLLPLFLSAKTTEQATSNTLKDFVSFVDAKSAQIDPLKVLVIIDVDTISHTNLPKVIQSLQKKKIHVIGLTQTPAGKTSDSKNKPTFKLRNHLKKNSYAIS